MTKYRTTLIAVTALCICWSCSQPAPSTQVQSTPSASQPPKWGIVIHTGAGKFTLAAIAQRRDAMTWQRSGVHARNELDASIMDGSTMKAGAVAGLKHVIVSTARGNVMMSFNTTGMARGYVGAEGKPTIMFTVNDSK